MKDPQIREYTNFEKYSQFQKKNTTDNNNLQKRTEIEKTNDKKTTDKQKSYTTPTSLQTSILSQICHHPNKNHKLISRGVNILNK